MDQQVMLNKEERLLRAIGRVQMPRRHLLVAVNEMKRTTA